MKGSTMKRPDSLPKEGYAPKYHCPDCNTVDFVDDHDSWSWDTLQENLELIRKQGDAPEDAIVECSFCGSTKARVVLVAVQREEGGLDYLLPEEYWRKG